jgi:hypothetical protein
VSVLIPQAALEQRRVAAHGPLRSLAESLTTDLEVLLDRDIYFPAEKALLSRSGGRCEIDGTMLEFDPLSPRDHRCPRCGHIHTGELHDRFWVYWYQLWLAERAVHGAVLWNLGYGERLADFARDVLSGYADRYLRYPNVDNVLGPTRLFFSTYLESIWLLQICVATDMLASREPRLADRVRSEILEPSRTIIAEYDEGGSNRQVWNDAALLAAARVLGDENAVERSVFGESGVARQINDGLLRDGTWYEGENYHLFAHRGLWYGVTMAELAGLAIEPALRERFQRGFAAPFLSALPDFTLPSRRDSQYAISLRQWRIAEHCELGLARESDSTLRGALARMYSDEVPRTPTRRERSSADVERNAAPSALTRADLSWRALLFALPDLPPATASAPSSALLDGQGLAVFRRERGQAYVALDYGHSGGGHGHPDRLNLLLVRDAVRWLDDFGTGSYVERSLHWYRSTLAHNAPLANGRSQHSTNGALLAYDEHSDAGWVVAEAEIAPGVRVRRTIVVLSSYLVDVVEWVGAVTARSARVGLVESPLIMDLPMHADLELAQGVGIPERASLVGGHGLEDGFDFAHDTTYQLATANATVTGRAGKAGNAVRLWASSSADCEWWRATAPGAPGRGDHAFRIVRARASQGRHCFVWSWTSDVSDVQFAPLIRVTRGGETDEHRLNDGRWTVERRRDGASSGVILSGAVPPPAPHDDRSVSVSIPPEPLRLGRDADVTRSLGIEHYRRSEQTWEEAGRPGATITLRADHAGLHIAVMVPRSDVTFAPRNAENPFDNESADVNGDGIQLYVRANEAVSSWMLVPELGADRVRVRPIAEHETSSAPRARWHREGDGYRVAIELPGTIPSAIDVIVNEMPRGRQRRRGQLVLSGARGEFVYLRGDRQDEHRLVPLEVAGG